MTDERHLEPPESCPMCEEPGTEPPPWALLWTLCGRHRDAVEDRRGDDLYEAARERALDGLALEIARERKEEGD